MSPKLHERSLLNLLFVVLFIVGLIGVTPAQASHQFLTAAPFLSYQSLYISLTDRQTVGGITASDEDILRFDGKNWWLFFDGSDVGIGSSDLVAFLIVGADTILMAFNTNLTVNGIAATPQDVLRFDATSLGSLTAGRFSLYFDGSDVGLDDGTNEKIDALTLRPNGRLLISTNGPAVVPGLIGARDEDVLAFTPTSLGRTTRGTWSMFFDGSDVELGEAAGEDIDGVDIRGGKVYLSTQGDFSVTGIHGADEDVFVCAPTSLGRNTACNYSPQLYFDGSTWGLAANDVDAFNFRSLGSTATPSPTISPTVTHCPVPTREYLSVEPVISPTDQTSQVIMIRLGHGEWAKVSSESGDYTANFSSGVALVTVPLLADTTHHLTVYGHVGTVINPGGCEYGNYTLSTGMDRFGAPLRIVQMAMLSTLTPSPTPGGNLFVFSPIADTYVNAFNYANYGTLTILRTGASPEIRSYLRFQVQGLTSPVTKATLRLWAQTTSSEGYQVRGVSDNTWTETTLHYHNAPPVGDVIGSSGAMNADTWTEVDVTPYITGNGDFNLALTSTSSISSMFASREASYNRPELIVETQSGDAFIATFTPSPTNARIGTGTPTITLTLVPSQTESQPTTVTVP